MLVFAQFRMVLEYFFFIFEHGYADWAEVCDSKCMIF